MANQIVVSAGAKVRDLQDVIIGTSGVLSSLAFDVANGVPKLDSNGKILVSQLPNSVMEYKGTWNAATNTPTLVNGTGNQGDVYLCNVAGTVNFGAGPIAFVVGDQVIYSGSIWQRASGATGTVTSVALTESGDSLNITGSPITTSGTINIGFNGTNLQYVNGAGNLTTFPTLITSIGLTMPSAFSVANSPLTANGTIAVTGAGVASQYIRGDGTLADFPTSGGGGSSVSYYLNGGTSQGTIGGTTYYEMSKTAVTGTGVDFTKTGDGFIVAFLTDANDPAQLNIPAGNWNYEIYASMSSNGGTPEMYAELYVYDGTTFTLISTSPHEILYDGTALNLYTFAMAVPATSLTLTDRLAVKLYATNSGGKTTTIHTQDGHLCQIITTFSTGITALNGLTAQVQYFQTGTSGTDFNISSTTATHTFNLPTASAANRGALSSADWSIFNGKQPQLNGTGFVKASGTTITYDNSTYYLASNPSAFIALTALSAGTGISYNNTTGVITNSAPDQTVSLTAGAGISVSGSYPSFTIASTITQYTDALARAALSFAAGSGAYNSTTGVITIPTDNNQIANGAGYITSSALSGYLPLTGGTLTGILNINLSSGNAMNVAGNAIFRGDTGVGTPRQLIITSGGSTPVYLEAKGYGANYQTDFGIKTFNNVGTAFEVFYADSSGRVGINQTSPSYQLDVNGTGRFSSSVTSDDLILTAGTLFGTGNTGFSNRLSDTTLYLQMPATGFNITDNALNTRFILSSTGAATFSSSVQAATNFISNIYIDTPSVGTSAANNATYNYLGYSGYWGIRTTQTGFNFALDTYNGGTPKNVLTITQGGNVGIGTSTVTTFATNYTALNINAATGYGSGTIFKINNVYECGFYSETGITTLNIAGVYAITGSFGTAFKVASGGNVGIGTSSPAVKLHIIGGVEPLRIESTNATGGNYLQYKNTSGDLGYIGWGSSANNNLNIANQQNADITFLLNSTERMRITSGGQVLIGATSYDGVNTNALQIKGGTAQFLINNTAGTTNHFTIYSASDGNIYNIFGTTGQLLFGTGAKDTTSFSEKMRLFNNGNLLIGTTTDNGYKLYVDGGSSNGMAFYSTSAANQFKIAGSAAAMTFSNTISGPSMGGSLGVATSAGDFLSGTAAGDTIFINQFSGKRLYAVSYSGGVYLSSGATSWTANSDIRLKNINGHIENAVEKLSTLQTINFSYKDDKTNKQNLGLIAQEVEKIFPELIDKNGDGMLGVRYTELVPVLIKAVQELKLEIETLKNK